MSVFYLRGISTLCPPAASFLAAKHGSSATAVLIILRLTHSILNFDTFSEELSQITTTNTYPGGNDSVCKSPWTFSPGQPSLQLISLTDSWVTFLRSLRGWNRCCENNMACVRECSDHLHQYPWCLPQSVFQAHFTCFLPTYPTLIRGPSQANKHTLLDSLL